ADRLVTAARALEAVEPPSVEGGHRERLLKVADGCRRLRRTIQDLPRPAPDSWVALAPAEADEAASPLTGMEGTVDEMALAVAERPGLAGQRSPGARPSLFVPDAFDNPEYVQFAVKGTVAALICYVSFVGFDYPGIYTSVITCFVVSLSTVGASNQKGILRFGGAAAGG